MSGNQLADIVRKVRPTDEYASNVFGDRARLLAEVLRLRAAHGELHALWYRKPAEVTCG